jgi:hypothetical protein
MSKICISGGTYPGNRHVLLFSRQRVADIHSDFANKIMVRKPPRDNLSLFSLQPTVISHGKYHVLSTIHRQNATDWIDEYNQTPLFLTQNYDSLIFLSTTF